MLEEGIVHLPKLTLFASDLCCFCRYLGLGMNLSQREVAEHET